MDERQKIEVISVCDTCGQLRPLRFRFEDREHRLHRVDIQAVVSCREVALVGIEAMIYLCRARVEGRERMFELRYAVRAHNWELVRWVY